MARRAAAAGELGRFPLLTADGLKDGLPINGPAGFMAIRWHVRPDNICSPITHS
jgi:hypothetical protein